MNNVEPQIFDTVASVAEIPLKQKIFMLAMLITGLFVVVKHANKRESCIVWRDRMDFLVRDLYHYELIFKEYQEEFQQLPVVPSLEAFWDYRDKKRILDECLGETASKQLKHQVDSVAQYNGVGSEKFDTPIPKVNCTKEEESVENALQKLIKEEDIIKQSEKKLKFAQRQCLARHAKALSHKEKRPSNNCLFPPHPATLRKRVRHFL
jgi:hypothetical protein